MENTDIIDHYTELEWKIHEASGVVRARKGAHGIPYCKHRKSDFVCTELKIIPRNDFTLTHEMMSGFEELEILKISCVHGAVLKFGENCFASNKELREIILNCTIMQNLPANLFKYTKKLEKFWLRFPFMCDEPAPPIPPTLFSGLSKLEAVQIASRPGGPQLDKIPERLFEDSPLLRIVNLELQNISHLPEDLFINNPNLEELNLRYNPLNQLPDNLLRGCLKLKILFLPKGCDPPASFNTLPAQRRLANIEEKTVVILGTVDRTIHI